VTKYDPISLDGVKTYPLRDRESKVGIEDLGKPWKPGGSLGTWFGSLPKILAADDLRKVASRIVGAVQTDNMVLLAIGAHVIKVGLNPIIIRLLEKGVIKGLAMNGAGIIHDTELAMAGHTSEDVSAHLGEGKFGMAEETGRYLNEAIIDGARAGIGLGESVGTMLVRENFPHNNLSLLARAFQLDVPVTVHVAVGTDTIHFHPGIDASALGKTTHMDFLIFANLVSKLEHGVFINLGSAVVLPEVFLKAITLVRNLGHDLRTFTTVNMDFIRHYRPLTNVVQRPTTEGGEGYSLVGHHEIMFPLLAAGVIEGLEEAR
jgi:hypothetical protein